MIDNSDGCGLLDDFRILSDRLLPHIVRLLPSCVRTLGGELSEDAITRNLVSGLAKSPELRRVADLQYHFEPFRADDRGNQWSTGQIDFIAQPFGVRNRELYLAYECKRLNVRRSGGPRRSKAAEYVKDGVARFVTEQYSAGLPLACMLGYVEDGDVHMANRKVRQKIDDLSEASVIGLPIALSEDVHHIQFETVHSRESSDQSIRIRHQLVSCIL